MRLVLLSALLGAVFTASGVAQSPTRAEQTPPVEAQAGPAAAQAGPTRDEIDELKATVSRLQQRLNQLSPPPEEAPSAGMPVPSLWKMNAAWQNGVQITSAGDEFRLHVGGTLQFDTGWNAASQAVQFGPGGIGELQDGSVFRRARLRVDGSAYQHFEWLAEFDFATNIENDTGTTNQTVGVPGFVNVWLGVNELPLIGTVRAGWMKEPIGLAFQTSSRWLSFMERAPGTASFFLYSPGVQVRNSTENERLTWAAGIFHGTKDNFGFGIGDGRYAETGRLTWLAWDEGEEQLLHLGIGAYHRHLTEELTSLRGRPSVRTMPLVVEPALALTGNIAGTTRDLVNAELAGVYGPWSLQAEYFVTFLHDAVPQSGPLAGIPRGTLFYQGGYVEVLYFLTGEHRAYNRKDATFDRVVPLRNFNVWSGEYGWGAWQVGVRYAYLDLQDKEVKGATLHDVVLGLNWFLNPNMKVQWDLAADYRRATPPGSNGFTWIFGTRFALDF
jgi:phosphate-selective porin OprO/OprP